MRSLRFAPTAASLVALVAFAFLGLGPRCDAGDLQVVSPREGAVVSGAALAIEVRIDPAAYDVSTLSARLNGHPVPLSGGPERYAASVPVGSPPAGKSLLQVSARALNGVQVSVDRHFTLR